MSSIFTHEIEKDNVLPFLDIKVINKNSKLEFDIYRKPTFTSTLITSNSFHNYKHKMSAIHCMAHRMVSIPLDPTRYNAERNYIIEIGRINGYPHRTVNNIIRRHELRKQQLNASVLFASKIEDIKRIVLPYMQPTTDLLSRLYRNFDFQTVNSNPHSLQKLLGSAKDGIPDLLKSGIYEISCQDGCDFAYYGKTERNLVVRYSEHENCFAKNNTRSAVAKHLIENNHATDLTKMKLLQSVSGRNTCADATKRSTSLRIRGKNR